MIEVCGLIGDVVAGEMNVGWNSLHNEKVKESVLKSTYSWYMKPTGYRRGSELLMTSIHT